MTAPNLPDREGEIAEIIKDIVRDLTTVLEKRNADLRACAEALVFADQCCRKPDDCKWGGTGGCGYESGGKLTRAALARSGVQEVRK